MISHRITTRAVEFHREDTGEHVCAFEKRAGQEGHAVTIRRFLPLDFVVSLCGDEFAGSWCLLSVFAGAEEWRIEVVQLLSDTSHIVLDAARRLFVEFSVQRLLESLLVAAIEWQFGALEFSRWWYKPRVCKVGRGQTRFAAKPYMGYGKTHQLVGWLIPGQRQAVGRCAIY